ncbi:MAG: tRNA (adenosine(37)-N6)-dimethylallyltransferase MiaA [Bacteroidales bacterium]|nr:tRNA (adenosine(37)-N6)-dimethylallyltransferase MiaA [Bacteroidales bacterium]
MIVVLGPTASGKTRYAVHLAEKLDREEGLLSEIISADSRQIYRGMDIGTGKDLCEYGDIPYHLIDIADAGTQYNVYEFKRDFEAAWEDIRSRGRVPILCGGTGLYINSVTAGYDFKESQPLSRLRENKAPHNPYIIGTLVSREVRNARIDARLDARLKEGMVEEIKGLLDGGIPAEKLISYGLEYRYVTLYVLGELGFDEMREKLATAIHQFAKRQMTWFRGMERSGAVIHWTEV